jgi:hypothetical protein
MNKIMSVNFHGTELYGFDLSGVIYIALKPIVLAMGLDWSAQYRRAQRDPIIKEGIAMMAIPFGRDGLQDQVCLRIDLVHGLAFYR